MEQTAGFPLHIVQGDAVLPAKFQMFLFGEPLRTLWLLMGADMFLTLQAWHEPGRIFSLAGVAAFGRTEADTEDLFSVQRDYLCRTYPQARIFTLSIPGVVDVSSTELRQRLAKSFNQARVSAV